MKRKVDLKAKRPNIIPDTHHTTPYQKTQSPRAVERGGDSEDMQRLINL